VNPAEGRIGSLRDSARQELPACRSAAIAALLAVMTYWHDPWPYVH